MITPSLPAVCGLKYGVSGGSLYPSTSGSFLVSAEDAVFYSRPPWDPMTIDQIFLPEVHGKKLSHITETQFRPLRVRTAHAILDSGEPTLLADEGLDLQKLIKWLPLAKCITRRMLKNEFPADFLHFVAEDGSVRG